MFRFPFRGPSGTSVDRLSCHKLCVDMHVNKTKFERNYFSRASYHMTCIAKTKHTSLSATLLSHNAVAVRAALATG